jgi:DNA-binding response OmpR family regulator
VLLHVADAQISLLLATALRLEGLPDAIVPRDADPLRGISTERYSLALIQHDPPAIDGLEFARRLHAGRSAVGDQLPVVLVTADPQLATHNSDVALDWLVAPFSLSYARTKLRFWTLRLACRWVRARVPDDEAQRLEVLHQLAVLDTPREERFDRITRITAATLDVPIALISLVDRDRQWFKSCVGIDVSETPRDMAFCAHAVQQRADVVVADTLLDERFADNPLVVDGPRIRFYAGAPLLMDDGTCLGTLCVADTRPRHLSGPELEALHDLRDMALEQLLRTSPAGD